MFHYDYLHAKKHMTCIPHHWSAYYGFVAFQQQIEPRKNATFLFNLRKQSPREVGLYILENNFRTFFKLFQNGQTALSIAQRLGYISVVETLKVVTQQEITTTTTTTIEEKYKILAPESMQETFMSDSEDEGGKISIHSKWSCKPGIFQFNLFHFILPLP